MIEKIRKMMENNKGSTVSKNYEKSFSVKTDTNCFEKENPTENTWNSGENSKHVPRLEVAGRKAGGARETRGLPAPSHSGGTPRLSCPCSKACHTPCPGSYQGTIRILWEFGSESRKVPCLLRRAGVEGQRASWQDGIASGRSESLSTLTENARATGRPVFP